MSPEIVNKRDYLGPPTDVWASGILCYAMFCGAFPFKGQSDKDLFAKINRGALCFPDHVPKDAQDFISSMITVNPAVRRTAAQLQKSPWLNNSVLMIQ